MLTKITVAMSKESGPPECESLNATCTLDLVEDWPTLQNHETVQRAVLSAVVACHQALEEEAVGQPRAPGVVQSDR